MVHAIVGGGGRLSWATAELRVGVGPSGATRCCLFLKYTTSPTVSNMINRIPTPATLPTMTHMVGKDLRGLDGGGEDAAQKNALAELPEQTARDSRG